MKCFLLITIWSFIWLINWLVIRIRNANFKNLATVNKIQWRFHKQISYMISFLIQNLNLWRHQRLIQSWWRPLKVSLTILIFGKSWMMIKTLVETGKVIKFDIWNFRSNFKDFNGCMKIYWPNSNKIFWKLNILSSKFIFGNFCDGIKKKKIPQFFTFESLSNNFSSHLGLNKNFFMINTQINA